MENEIVPYRKEADDFQSRFLEQVRSFHHNEFTNRLSEFDFCVGYGEPSWRIGPFEREEGLTFRKARSWADPLSIGWSSKSLYNPSVIPHGDGLAMAYRASPLKESLSSRIGMAFYTPALGWVDAPENPVVYPTGPFETMGCEDPKLYSLDGQYYLFYQGVWRASDEYRLAGATPAFPLEAGATSTMLAVSTDLRTWRKLGVVVPLEVSRGWSKGAVIPKDGFGRPVRIGGQYRMYVSEGCGGRQQVGRSDDLIHWAFEARDYLVLERPECHIEEVACASLVGRDQDLFVLDFYYQSPDGKARAGQALYKVDDPYRALDIRMDGGTLSWGGMVRYREKWLFAQGWDAPEGSEELHFYAAPIRDPEPRSI